MLGIAYGACPWRIMILVDLLVFFLLLDLWLEKNNLQTLTLYLHFLYFQMPIEKLY